MSRTGPISMAGFQVIFYGRFWVIAEAPAYTKSAARIAARITYGKGDVMPAFVGTLSEREIWDTANHLRSLQKAGAEQV